MESPLNQAPSSLQLIADYKPHWEISLNLQALQWQINLSKKYNQTMQLSNFDLNNKNKVVHNLSTSFTQVFPLLITLGSGYN